MSRPTLTVHCMGIVYAITDVWRVAYSLGADAINLIECEEPKKLRLYTAKELVRLSLPDFPRQNSTLILETWGAQDIAEVDWCGITDIVVGGVAGIRKDPRCQSAVIPARNPCLVADQALAVALAMRNRRFGAP